MANILIIHGAYGNAQENWFPWLKKELESLGNNVFIPNFPTPEKQNLKNWLEILAPYEQYLNKDSIVIGHSLGPVFLLHVIEKLKIPIKAAFFVSCFLSPLGNPDFDKINASFYKSDFNWAQIKANCKEFYIYHSDDDPYVPIEIADKIARGLDVNIQVIEGAGHFNETAGYVTFPLLLGAIKQLEDLND